MVGVILMTVLCRCLLVVLLSMYRFERDETFDDPEKWKMWRLVLRPKDGVRCKVTLLDEHDAKRGNT